MKSVSLILAAIVIAFSLPACATTKKSDCCGSASCSAPDGKSAPTHSHGKKKAS